MSIFSMLSTRRVPCPYRCALLCLLTVVLLAGCAPLRSAPPVRASDVLTSMCRAEAALPTGSIWERRVNAAAGDDTASSSQLTDALFSALYGSECLSWLETTCHSDGTVEAPLVDEVAVFLATVQHPCEMAVFRCTDSAGAVAAAKQCRRRLDLIRQTWRGSDEEAFCGRGCVEVVDNYVLLVVASDPEAVLDAARRVIA